MVALSATELQLGAPAALYATNLHLEAPVALSASATGCTQSACSALRYRSALGKPVVLFTTELQLKAPAAFYTTELYFLCNNWIV